MNHLQIQIDKNSNLYINSYWIAINKNSDLESVFIEKTVEKIGVEKTGVTIIEEIDNLNKKINRKLQAKLIDTEISKFIENDEEIYDDDDSTQLIENYIYNPETKYINYHQEYVDSDSDNLEPYYDINGMANFSDVSLDLSNYEFYYFGLDSNDLKYYTRIVNDNPFYRISFYESSGEIKLNVIGDMIKTYKIVEENNTLRFCKTCVNLTQHV